MATSQRQSEDGVVAAMPGGADVDRPAAPGISGPCASSLGSKRVIQRLFNVSVPRARVPKIVSALRDRSER